MEGVEIEVGECGSFIREQLDAAEDRIIVVSPWLSEGYAKMLLEKKDEGVDVYVHTTEDWETGNHVEALNAFMDETEEVKSITPARKYGRQVSLIAGLSGALTLFLGLYITAFTLFSISVVSLIFYLAGGRRTETRSELRIDDLGIYPENLHSKIYVFDDVVMIGSANFTYTGFNENLETVLKIENDELVEDVMEQIEQLSTNRKF